LYGLGASLRFFADLGWEAITEHVLDLSELAIARLEAIPGVCVRTPRERGERLSIVSFDPPHGDPDGVVAALRKERIHTASRGGHVRVSFHVYNNAEDVERLAQALTQ
jgi:cysteine desulfurase / selenocysteine lyase